MQEAGGGGDGSGETFYSHCLLSRKGPLGTIWTAAHCCRKLRKHQIAETDISSNIDRIMLAEVPIAFRILGFLLIGLVRVYSKKLEYLYHDCNEALFRIKNSVVPGKIGLSKEDPSTPIVSIMVPERFELDAFDLEGFEDSLVNVARPSTEITHQGVQTEEAAWPSMEKMLNYDETTVHWEAGPSFFMLEDEWVLKDPYMHFFQWFLPELLINFATVVFFFGCSVFLPDTIDIDLEISNLHHSSGLMETTEKLQSNEFHLERCLELNFCSTEETSNLSQCFDEPSSCAGQMNLQDALPDVKGSLVITEVHPFDGTPMKTSGKNPSASDDVTFEVMPIPTPSNKERERKSRKRKRLFDRSVILSNEALRCRLHNTSDLVRVPRSVPHAALSCWRSHKISNLHKSFLEPLTPCISSELRTLFTGACFDHLESKEFSDAHFPSDRDENEALTNSSEEPLSPENGSGNASTSCHCLEALEPSNSNEARFKMPMENGGKDPPAIESPDFWLSMMSEEIVCQEGLWSQDTLSVRTRTVAQHLHKYFSMQESKQKGALKLSCLLTGRSRKACARLFYETLVLRSEGYIDATQDSPYADILVLPTPQIKAMF